MSEVTLYYQHGRHVCTPTETVSEYDLQGYTYLERGLTWNIVDVPRS